MSKLKYIHLRVHSEFSIIDGIVRIKPLIDKVSENDMPAVALTDQMNLFAAVKFYKAARAKGIKPIIGSDLWLANPDDKNTPYHCVALCQNQQGYHNLMQLISLGYKADDYNGSAQIQREQLAQFNEGLIILSGGREGDIGQAFLQQKPELVASHLKFWTQHFPERYYLELQRTGRAQEETYIQQALQLSEQHQIPVVASNDVRFLESEDFAVHDTRVCIYNGDLLANPKRKKLYSEQQYLRTPLEMQQLFADIPQALENTIEIAKRCSVELRLYEYFLPDFPIPKSMTQDEYFIQQSQQGLGQRLTILLNEHSEDYLQQKKIYEERLQIELDVISKMGFAGYFLIVADFIQWSKDHGIPVGPGRGSGAGSLVAYALGITGLDPLAYDLLFERFLNPERVSLPDFDIDFCMDGRDRVIEYVANTYGRESVSQIITFGTMAAKAAVRDVGRVQGYPYGFIDKIAKLIPFELGMTLDKALVEEDVLQQRYKDEDEVREVIDMARALEGITRNVGKHAGGVVIAPSAITDFTPIYREPHSHSIVTQFDKDDDEAVGLVKFDFLGLRTLTIIDKAVITVNAKRKQQQLEPIDIDLIPVVDAAVFVLLQACETTAVFQLESRGMKDLIKRLQPDCFEEIIALVALFRPGPLQSGMVDDFIDRKHGVAAVEYPHPELEPILSPTYGVILYQEQVMQIAQVLAGYTLGAADLLRRAMGKKKPEEMAKQRQIFTDGAVARGVENKTATYIFDLMEKFAGYGFNKSHSAAYALVAYQTAWLKAHYPAEFMASVLSSDMDNTDKVVIFIEECKRMQLTVLPPNINQGQYYFTVDDAGNIVYGLGAVKGAGLAAIESIINEREQQGEFSDLFEFCCRNDLKKVNRKVLEALIKSGSFDCLKVTRAKLSASIVKALKISDQNAKNNLSGQQDLFSKTVQLPQETGYCEAQAWTELQRLQNEKDSLGYYLSGHPLDSYRGEISQFCRTTLANVKPTYEQTVTVAGQIVAMRTLLTKRGDRMAIISLDDGTARVEAAVFSDVYQEVRHILAKDEIVVIEGEVSIDDYTGGHRMSCRNVMSLVDARVHYGKHVLLKLDHNVDIQSLLTILPQTIMSESAGTDCPLVIEYQGEEAKARLKLPKQYRLVPSDERLEELQTKFKLSVAMEY